MPLLRSFALLLCLSMPCLTVMADDHTVDPSRVFSVVTTDWNDDGSKDRALLVDTGNDDGADLHIYLNVDDEDRTVLVKGGFVWSGSAWGQQPKLSLNDKQSLIVHSENVGIGRYAWEQTVIIAWRNEQFVVAGYTYNSYDRLDPDNVVDCDLNLLTGKGKRNGKSVTVKKKKPMLLLWKPDEVHAVCH